METDDNQEIMRQPLPTNHANRAAERRRLIMATADTIEVHEDRQQVTGKKCHFHLWQILDSISRLTVNFLFPFQIIISRRHGLLV